MSGSAQVQEPTVYQIEENGYGVDIAPSYAAVMRRLLHRVTSHPKYATHKTRVVSNYTDFSRLDLGGHGDTDTAAIRYAVATVPGQFVIAEHGIWESPDRESLLRRINILAEFDPSFEVLLRLYCVKIGELSLRKAGEEVADVIAAGIRGTIRLHGSVHSAYDHLRDAHLRNGGVDFMLDGLAPENLVDKFPGLVRERFWLMAAEMRL